MEVELKLLADAHDEDALRQHTQLLAPQIAVKAARLSLSARMRVEDAFQSIVANCLAQVQGNEDQVANSDDVEALHQMRVGMRRLRSALNMFKSLVELPEAMQQDVDWLGAQLGAARDWDVLAGTTVDALGKSMPEAPDIEELKKAATDVSLEKHKEAAAAIKSARYTRLILSLHGWLQSKGWRADIAPDKLAGLRARLPGFARATLRKDQRRLCTRGKDLRTATPEARHRVRIAAKKSRYAAEFFQSLYPARRLRRYVEALAALQDELGYLNDAAVAGRLLSELTARHAPLEGSIGFAKGVLAARLQHDDTKIRTRWKHFAAMPLPFKR